MNSFEVNGPWQFLLKYNRSEPVEYCQSADVSLYHLDKDYFCFVKTAPGIDLCDLEIFPFKQPAQQKVSIKGFKLKSTYYILMFRQ